MRNCRKNKKKMYYSLYLGQDNASALDDNGNPLVDEYGDVVLSGESNVSYGLPTEFMASLSETGETTTVEFGTNTADYDGVIVAPVGKYNITENSLIWYQSEIEYMDEEHTVINPHSADYTVKSIRPLVNEVKYILKRKTK